MNNECIFLEIVKIFHKENLEEAFEYENNFKNKKYLNIFNKNFLIKKTSIREKSKDLYSVIIELLVEEEVVL
ncbi:hypothetical protein [Cetobacterium sp.]|uniref:hypothetical protein n=1 Tax=Cetobacterium sp. TaxID=2071632 RepID=UPI003F2A5811